MYGTLDIETQLSLIEATQPSDLKDCAPGYYFRSRKVSPEFRAAIRAACPFSFTGTPDAKFCRNLLEYLLFPRLFLGRTDRVVVPCGTLAVLDGKKWTSNYKALKRLHLFEKKAGIPLDIRPWHHQCGRARTVLPKWPAPILAARKEELARWEEQGRFGQRPRVYFDTGEPVGRSRRAKL